MMRRGVGNWHPLIVLIHWATMMLILVQYGLARVMGDQTRDLLSRFALYQWHKSFGLTLAGLVVLLIRPYGLFGQAATRRI